ncbi:MAG: hypothetical protein Q8L01_00255, partial [Candidatus Woesebacteria bacterium]|nr:hypothetical protein [Candidatus Woesebacteria bacterium]
MYMNSTTDSTHTFTPNEFVYTGKIKRQELCPYGFIFLTNITYRTRSGDFRCIDEYDYYLATLRLYRQQYQDIYVGDA